MKHHWAASKIISLVFLSASGKVEGGVGKLQHETGRGSNDSIENWLQTKFNGSV